MCCPGCQAVAESIVSMGLDDYYQFREKMPEVSPKDIEFDLEQLLFYDRDKVQDKYLRQESSNHRTISLMVSGIVCAACTWLLETRLSQLDGVIKISVNQSTSRALVTWDPETIQLSDILRNCANLGYQAQPYDMAAREESLIKEKKRFLQRLAIAGLGMMQVMMYSLGFYLDLHEEMSVSNWHLLRWVSLLISTPVVFYAASPFYMSAYKSLRNKAVNMDVPVTIAIFAAWSASVYATFSGIGEVYFDSVSMFVFFLLTGRYIQMNAIHKSGRVLEERLGSQPEIAIRIRDGIQERVLLDDVEPGDVLIVKPASQIPCDGILLDDFAEIDESILTGESTPIRRRAQQILPAGAINTSDAFKIKVSSRVENSTLASIIKLLQDARETRPRIQTLANQIASYFVSAILILALVTAAYWYLHEPDMMFATVLAVLVITCPCALSLATPVAITAAMGNMTSSAILINRAGALFNLAQATDYVFDKTGTLTTGRFSLLSMKNLSDKTDSELLAVIAAMERQSEHPIASAFESIDTDSIGLESLKRLPGIGLEAKCDGITYQIGNSYLLPDEDEAEEFDREHIRLYLLVDEVKSAELLLTTEVRTEAYALIERLKATGKTLHLLSGDRSGHVNHIAQQLGFDLNLVKAGVTPQEKLDYIANLQSQKTSGEGARHAVMVGDGINDSPAMAAATVSIAMAQATDITKVNADMILLKDDLSLVGYAAMLSTTTRKIIKQNITWAVSYNLIGVPLAMIGWVTPWIAAIGMSFSSLVVVLNALRLTKK